MFIKRHKTKAQSTTEYVFFLIVLLGVFIYFQKYIVRGVSGRLRTVGESFANHRLWDPNKTLECAFDFQYTNKWYDAKCYFEGIGGNPGCGIPDCLAASAEPARCETCIRSCMPPGGECEVPL